MYLRLFFILLLVCFFFCCSYVSYFMVLLFFFFFKQKTAYEMRISDWSSDVCSSDFAGIRWGLSAEHRAGLGLPAELEQSSWRFGLRRMLLGCAVGCSDAYDSIEPYDEIGGLDAALIGPLVALLDALEVAHQELTRPASPQEWGSRLHDLMQLFFQASNEHDDYLLTQLEDLRETWLETCESVALNDELPLTVEIGRAHV